MQYRIQFVRLAPDGKAAVEPVDGLMGLFPSVHDAAIHAERHMKQAALQGDRIASYIIVDANDAPVDPLGKPLK